MDERIAIIGNTALDVILDIPSWPAPDQTMAARGMSQHPGGMARNVASALRQILDSRGITLVSRIGSDLFGQSLIDSAAAEDLDYTAVQTVADGSTCTIFVCSSSANASTGRGAEGRPDAKQEQHPKRGSRSMVAVAGVGEQIGIDDLERASDAIGSSAVFLISGLGALSGLEVEQDRPKIADYLERLRKRGIRIAADTLFDHRRSTADVRSHLDHVIRRINWFLPSAEEAATILGHRGDAREQAIALRRLYPNLSLAAIKDGSAGCAISEGADDSASYITAIETAVVDDTGAGDVWCAGFIAGMLRLECNAVRAAICGNAAAHVSIQARGATTAVPPWSELLRIATCHPQWEAGPFHPPTL